MPPDVDPVRISGRWVKHAYPGSDPLEPRDPPPDNRWQRGEIIDAMYLADEEDTAWPEWYRHLAENGIPPVEGMPRDFWNWTVDVEVADLSDEARLMSVGLRRPVPGRRTWRPFQHVGEALAAEGWAGLVAPSAARPAHRVICLFRSLDGSVAGATPDGPPTRITLPPAPPTGMAT